MEKTIGRLGWLFLLLGLGMLAGAGYAASRTAAFLRIAASAEGTVVALDESVSTDSDGRRSHTYRPVVEFTPASGAVRTFTSRTGSSPPAYDVGERVTVLYDPQDLGEARLKGTFSLWGLAIILGGIGVVFAGIGGGMIAVRGGRRKLEAELRLRGRRVQARFQSVERNTSIQVNGRSPWRILCQWQDPSTGLLHVFKSQNLWFDPTPYVQVQELTVFVDPAKPKRYVVDVGFLPKLAA
jgi:hypothetical protein